MVGWMVGWRDAYSNARPSVCVCVHVHIKKIHTHIYIHRRTDALTDGPSHVDLRAAAARDGARLADRLFFVFVCVCVSVGACRITHLHAHPSHKHTHSHMHPHIKTYTPKIRTWLSTQRASWRERSASSRRWAEAPRRTMEQASPDLHPEKRMSLSSPIITLGCVCVGWRFGMLGGGRDAAADRSTCIIVTYYRRDGPLREAPPPNHRSIEGSKQATPGKRTSSMRSHSPSATSSGWSNVEAISPPGYSVIVLQILGL